MKIIQLLQKLLIWLKRIFGGGNDMANTIIYNGQEYGVPIQNDTGVGEFTSNEGKKNPTGVNSERFNTYGGQYANVASGDYSHAEGNNTTASGIASHAEGQNCIASGDKSHVEGTSTQAIEDDSHAEGNHAVASGVGAHAEGSYTQAIGEEAHAEGDHTIASGVSSHAEGADTVASGLKSHAEGEYTQATHNGAHSEGWHTVASGNVGSHAEGNYTEASGVASHAQGSQTKATGNYSHAGGSETEAYGVGSLTSGWKTYAKGHYSTALGVGTIAAGDWGGIALGQYNVENENEIVSIGQGSGSTIYHYYYNDIEINSWDPSMQYNVGDVVYTDTGTAAQPYECIQQHTFKRPGSSSGASYWKQLAKEDMTIETSISRSTVLGFDRYNNLAIGNGNNKVAEYANYIQNSTMIGNGNTITAVSSNTTIGGVIEGSGNSIGGTSNNVHIEGNGNSITDGSSNSHIEGTNHQISSGSFNSHTEGDNNILSSGAYSHIEGRNNSVQFGQYSHVEGQNNTTTVTCGHIEGLQNNLNSGANYSHIEGGNNIIANGAQYSHVEGESNLITNGGSYSHAEGANNTITDSATHSHAEGKNNVVQANFSHAEGGYNKVTTGAQYSHVEGMHNSASGSCSHAQGVGTIAKKYAQTALGQYNIEDTDNDGLYAVIVGNGSTVNITIPTFDTSTSYAVGDIVIHDSDVYECTVATSGDWDTNNWTFIRHIEIIDGQEVVRSNAATLTWDGYLDVSGGFSVNGTPIGGTPGDIANPNISDAYNNTFTYNKGDYCIYNNNLYKCNIAITTAEDFDSTKWTATTVGNELLAIISRINSLETALNGYSFANSMTQAEYDQITPDSDTFYPIVG